MTKHDRVQAILDLLQEESPVTTDFLAARMKVSNMTIRRDVKDLESRGLVETYYGGIALAQQSGRPDLLSQEQRDNYFQNTQHAREKRAIARYAGTLVQSAEAIGIDNGMTCSQIPFFLAKDMPLIIYTYSYLTMDAIIKQQNPDLRLFMLGGYYHPHMKMFEYTNMVKMIREMHIDKLFLGTAGFSIQHGVSCVQSFEIPFRRALIEISDTVIVLADSSKLGKIWFDHYASSDEVDILITDGGISEEQKQAITDAGIDLRIV